MRRRELIYYAAIHALCICNLGSGFDVQNTTEFPKSLQHIRQPETTSMRTQYGHLD